MGDIVQGPWGSRAPDNTSSDDDLIRDKVQLEVSLIMHIVLNHLEELEIDVDNIEELGYIKDLVLVSESIRSFLLKSNGRYHPCQDVADCMYYWDGEKYQTQQSIIVEFK